MGGVTGVLYAFFMAQTACARGHPHISGEKGAAVPMTVSFQQSMLSFMSTEDQREELVRLVTYLKSNDCTEEEQDAALKELEARVLHPRVSALIFWPSQEGFDRELTPDEVVDVALAYRPIEL